jgi:hypothetical protein
LEKKEEQGDGAEEARFMRGQGGSEKRLDDLREGGLEEGVGEEADEETEEADGVEAAVEEEERVLMR